jgi:hypothetical protein
MGSLRMKYLLSSLRAFCREEGVLPIVRNLRPDLRECGISTTRRLELLYDEASMIDQSGLRKFSDLLFIDA